MVLTEKQKQELHSAILDYLTSGGFSTAAEAFKTESGAVLDPKRPGILERKWTSVVRLQKKVLDLEERLTNVSEHKPNKPVSDNLPRRPEKHSLTGFQKNITAVRFHPTYSLVFACSEDATIKVWDYESGEFEKTLKGHTNAVQDIAFNESGALLASCSADLTVKLWDVQSYTCLKTLYGHDHNVSAVCFVGARVVSVSRDKTIKVWEAESGYCLATVHGHDEWVRCVAASPQGDALYTGSSDHSVRAWKLDAAAKVTELGRWRGHEHVVECVATNSAKLPLILCSNARQWRNVEPGGVVASGSRDTTIRLWDASTGACVSALLGHENWVRDLFFHPAGKYLYSCSDDKSIRIWDLSQNRCIKTLQNAHAHFIAAMDYCKHNPHLATVSVDQTLKVWTLK